MEIKYKLINLIAGILSKSYYITQLSRYIVRTYDNDCNECMTANGEEKTLQMVLSISGNNGVVIDVGANLGDWSSMLIKNNYKGRLIAVDPLSTNLSKVRNKLNLLGFTDFQLIEHALSNKEGIINFYKNKAPEFCGHDSMYDMRDIGSKEKVDCIEVKCITLDQLIAQLNIDNIKFIKVDVEGGELSVLQGASKLLSLGAVDFIQIEFGHASRAARVYLHDIVNFIAQYDYKIFVIKPSGLLPLDFDTFTENKYSYINFLLVKDGFLDKIKNHLLVR